MNRQMNSNERVLDYLQTHDYLTNKESACVLGITRLANCISELRKLSVPIADEWVTVKNRNGKTVRFKRYFLERYK